LEIRKKSQGEFHPKIAATFTNLGNLKKLQGQFEESKDFFMKGHQINIAIYGENHPIIALDYENLADFFISINKFSDALLFFEKSYKIRQNILGEGNADTIRVLQGIQDMKDRLSPKLTPNYQRNLNTPSSGAQEYNPPRRRYGGGASIVHRKCF